MRIRNKVHFVRRRRLLVLIFAALAVASQLTAQSLCATTDYSDRRAASGFLAAVVDGFKYAKEGFDFDQQDTTSTNPLAVQVEMMLYMKSAVHLYDCAARQFEAFGRSDLEISLAALGFKTTFSAVADDTRKQVEQLATDSEATPEQMAELALKKGQDWKGLLNAVGMTTHVLVEMPDDLESYADRPAAEWARLKVSHEETKAAVARLQEIFGDSIIEGGKAGQPAVEATAGMLAKWLNEEAPGFKTADPDLAESAAP